MGPQPLAAAWRGVETGSSRCRSTASRSFPCISSGGIWLRSDVGFDPGMGVPLAHLVIAARRVPLVALEARDHAGRNPQAAEHQRQRGGKVLAVPLRMLRDEVLDGVDVVSRCWPARLY